MAQTVDWGEREEGQEGLAAGWMVEAPLEAEEVARLGAW